MSAAMSRLLRSPLRRSDSVYAGTSGGVFKSTDRGGSWTPGGQRTASISTSRRWFRSLRSWASLRGSDGRRVCLRVWTGDRIGFLRTVAGFQWRLSMPWPWIRSIQILFTSYAGGLFKSKDGGETVETFEQRSAPVLRLHCDPPRRPSHLFVGTSGGLFRSMNGGEDWNSFPVGADMACS